MWSNQLSEAERAYTLGAMEALRSVSWAAPLLARVAAAGGVCSQSMPLLFEVRFAYELQRCGVGVEYEYPTGVGNSTVDFRTRGSQEWLIELVSVRESVALQRATHQNGLRYGRSLITGAADPAASPEAEMITAMGKIAQKVFAN